MTLAELILQTESCPKEERRALWDKILEMAKQDVAKSGWMQTPVGCSITLPEKPRRKRNTSDIEGFSEFYDAYPHKVARGYAEKAYVKARHEVDQETLLKGVEYYKRTKPDDTPFAYPASWLNAKRWLDGQADVEIKKEAESMTEWKQKIAGVIGVVPTNVWFKDVAFNGKHNWNGFLNGGDKTHFVVPNTAVETRLKTVYAQPLRDLFGQFEVRVR